MPTFRIAASAVDGLTSARIDTSFGNKGFVAITS
jgi:hypothetical protein